ncbi:MAG: HemK family protein methyltransferase, partial [Bacteroidetes bacterium]|nr:HemK family protein methyltransferase [Bacteroidota bacterium]
KNAAILDVCTGSGCIALALKHYLPHSVVTATDISVGALEVAEANAKRLNLDCRFEQKDFLKSWAEFSSGNWDVIVSNPPYIPESFMQTIQNQVLQEPHEALFVQDMQALIFYEALGMLAAASLNEGGLLIAECHFDKTNEVAELWRSRFGFECTQLDDLQGISRFVLAKKHRNKNFNQIKTEL